MMPYNISQSTIWIVGGFLLTTLALGLYAGRGIKDFKEYALGNRRFSDLTLVLTFIATWIGGGSIIGATSEVYKIGILALFTWFAGGFQFLLIALFLSKKLSIYKNVYTLGDLLNIFYGEKVKIFAGILSLVKGICSISIQLLFFSKIIENFFSIHSYWGIIFGGLILSIYSIFGGIKSVTKTDIFQFIILIVILPIILTFLLHQIGSYKDLFLKVPKEKFLITESKFFSSWLWYTLLRGLSFDTFVIPPLLQRIFMANSHNQVKKLFLSLGAFNVILALLVGLIGLTIVVLYPDLNNNNIIFHVINDIQFSYVLKGVIISGFVALIMSTADSHLHASGVVAYNDVLKPIFKIKKQYDLKFVKFTTFILSFITIISALFFVNISYFRTINFYAFLLIWPILIPSTLIGIIGLKTSKKYFFVGMITGLLVLFVSLNIFKFDKILCTIISMASNAISYMIFHIIQNKGIAWVKRGEENNKEEKLWIPNTQKIFNALINLIPTPKRIYNYSRNQVMKNGSQNMLFGIYACINFTLPYFLWNHHDPEKYNLMTNMRFIGGVMAALLIVKDKWKEFLKPYYSLYWHITLMYSLPFITTVMFLLTGGSISWLMNIGTSIFFLIMLVTGEVFLILAPLGVGLALIFYKYYIGPIQISTLGFDINYLLIYQVLFSTVIGLLFAYKKRIFGLIKGNIGLNLGSALCHEIRNTLFSLSCNQFNRKRMRQIEEQGTKNIEGKACYVLPEQLFKSFLDQTNEAINFDQDTLKVIRTFETIFKDYKKEIANPKVYSMKSVVKYTLKELHFLPGQKEKVKLNLTDDFYVKIPKSPFAFVISNIIRNAFKHGEASAVEIKLENHKLIIRDNGKGVPSSELERIFKMHYTTGKKNDSSGIGLGFAKLIVNSSYGEIWCESEQGENSYAEFIIQFPEVPPSEITKNSLTEMKEECKKEGEYNEKENIAIIMLEEGESIRKIEKYTKLDKSEIQDIKRKVSSIT